MQQTNKHLTWTKTDSGFIATGAAGCYRIQRVDHVGWHLIYNSTGKTIIEAGFPTLAELRVYVDGIEGAAIEATKDKPEELKTS